ncbi:MAG: gliding motility-associated C-terminal domain-containing protein [Flavobacteriales bacterium]
MFLVASQLSVLAALAPPILRCISLDDNGNATLYWDSPADPTNSFYSYKIYYRDGSGGTYTVVSEINDIDSLFATVIGNFNGSSSFYIVTISNGGLEVSVPSAIVSPIMVSLEVAGREVDVTWTPTPLPSPDSIYTVYHNIDGSGWELVGAKKIPANTHTDDPGVCKGNVRYNVEISGIGGCKSRSNSPTVLVEDNTPPEISNLTFASVDTATGIVELGWEKSASSDVYGYQLNYFLTKTNIIADTVFGGNILSSEFSKGGINPVVQSETLSVAAFDSCFDSTGSKWYNQAADDLRFATLFVDTTYFDRCQGKIGLKWNMPTDSTPVGVRKTSSYQVFRKINNGASQLVVKLAAGDSVFLDSGLIKGSRYDYVIVAHDDSLGVSALSNVFRLKVSASDIPDLFDISSITNDHNSGNNQIHVQIDTTNEVIRYGLFRSSYENSGFQEVAFMDESGESNFLLEDPSGRADQTDFFYWVVGYDYCEDSIASTNVAKSMFITGFKHEEDLYNELEWTAYEGFDEVGGNSVEYSLLRVTNQSQIDTLLDSPHYLTFNDTIFNLSLVGGDVCYYVIASTLVNPNLESKSNLFCTTYNPLVFIPNAFTPDDDGVNDVFLPDVNFVDIYDYNLSIYDRTGSFVFGTSNAFEGWDGQGMPTATYVYDLNMKNARNESVHFSGKVMLIR